MMCEFCDAYNALGRSDDRKPVRTKKVKKKKVKKTKAHSRK